MQIPIDTNRKMAPKLQSRRGIYESQRVYIDPDARARLNRLLLRFEELTSLRPSISTLLRLGLRELEARIERGTDDGALLRRKIVEAAGRDIKK